MPADNLFSRDEVMAGLPARRAAALLFLIESRTAHLVDRNRHAMAPFRSEERDHERELAFVEAFALGRTPPLRPTIQDLEHYAEDWADLVPQQSRMRAALAHALGEKFTLPFARVPGIRAALRLDSAPVRQTFQRMYGSPIETIYAEQLPVRSRLDWERARARNKLESLPPFWMTYVLTVMGPIGPGILALPIALAVIGPIPALLLLLLVGVINIITVVWIAESSARTADIRYGGAYFGRMVKEYIGKSGAVLLTAALVINSVLGLVAYTVGLVHTFAVPNGTFTALMIVLLFAGTLWVITHDTVQSSVASAIGISGIMLGLLFFLALAAFIHIDLDNLGYVHVPGIGGNPFDVSILGLVFGTILISYFGHTSVGNCASIVLRRDPGARSLIHGVIAAQATVIALYAIWVLCINGTLSPERLADQTGTALLPLADIAGPAVPILGGAFAVIVMGSGLVSKATVLSHVMRDWLPHRRSPVVLLPRDQGRLILTPHGSGSREEPRFALTYTGLTDRGPCIQIEAFSNGRHWRARHIGTGTWLGQETLTRCPHDIRSALDLVVTCISSEERQVRLRVASGMRMRFEGEWTTAGLDLTRLFDIDTSVGGEDDAAALQRWLLRQGSATLEAIVAWTGRNEHDVRDQLERLTASGAVRKERQGNTTIYRARLAHRRARYVPDSLDPNRGSGSQGGTWSIFRGWSKRIRTSAWLDIAYVRSALIYSPLLVVALATEWVLLTGRGSFTGLLSFSGTIAIPVIAGLFPALLILSSRRKGDIVPGVVLRFLGWRWLVAAVYTFFLVSVLLHGLVVWHHPGAQAFAITLTLVTVIVTIRSLRNGAVAHRTVVTLRDDQRPDGTAAFHVVFDGAHSPAGAELTDRVGRVRQKSSPCELTHLGTIQRISTRLTPDEARDVKLWARRISPQGDVQGFPARVRFREDGRSEQSIDLGLSGGTARFSGHGAPATIDIELQGSPTQATTLPRTPRPQRKPVDVHALLAPPSAALAGESEP